MDESLVRRCEQLERDLERVRSCITESSVILALSDQSLRYAWICNPYPGWEVEAVLGRTDLELGDEPGLRALHALKQRVLESGEPGAEELELRLCGEPRTYAITAAPLRVEGVVAGVRTAALDVTRRRQALTEPGRTQEEVMLVSHDLRQPLNVIGLAAEVVTEVAEPGSMIADIGGRILSAVRSMAETLDDLLEVGMWEATGMTLHREPTDVVALVRQVLERSFTADQAQRITVKAPTRPARGVELDVDRTKLGRAIQNLVHNALKFSPEGSPVHVEVTNGEGRATIAVRDRGEGLDASAVERVFAKFAASASSRARGGQGLGLYATRLVAEAHGGSCRVTSRVGGGSTFSIDLPIDPGASSLRS